MSNQSEQVFKFTKQELKDLLAEASQAGARISTKSTYDVILRKLKTLSVNTGSAAGDQIARTVLDQIIIAISDASNSVEDQPPGVAVR